MTPGLTLVLEMGDGGGVGVASSDPAITPTVALGGRGAVPGGTRAVVYGSGGGGATILRACPRAATCATRAAWLLVAGGGGGGGGGNKVRRNPSGWGSCGPSPMVTSVGHKGCR